LTLNNYCGDKTALRPQKLALPGETVFLPSDEVAGKDISVDYNNQGLIIS
jgi:hypothetical protein